MRRAPAALLSLLLSLPAAGSGLVILSIPPVSGLLPAPILSLVQKLATVPFALVNSLPPDSLAGRIFYGTFHLLVPIFGDHALAAHSVLLSLPFLALAILLARRPAKLAPS